MNTNRLTLFDHCLLTENLEALKYVQVYDRLEAIESEVAVLKGLIGMSPEIREAIRKKSE